jgi:hypothetical protein
VYLLLRLLLYRIGAAARRLFGSLHHRKSLQQQHLATSFLH